MSRWFNSPPRPTLCSANRSASPRIACTYSARGGVSHHARKSIAESTSRVHRLSSCSAIRGRNLQAGNLARVHGRLALVFVEIGRHRDDRLVGRLTEVGLGILLERRQDEARQLLRRERVPLDRDAPVGAHVVLEHGGAALRVQHAQLLRGPADDDAAVVIDADYRGGERFAQGVGNEPRSLRGHAGDDGVGRAQVDADDRAHDRHVPTGSGTGAAAPGPIQDTLTGTVDGSKSPKGL